MRHINLRNASNRIIYLTIIGTGIFTYGIHTILNYQWLNLFLLIFTLFVICLILYLRNVLITISEKNISVEFKILGIVYKKLSFDYINASYDSTPPIEERLILINQNAEKLIFLLNEDLDKEEKYLLCIEIEYNLKKYAIGNEKNAKKDFNNIKSSLMQEGSEQ